LTALTVGSVGSLYERAIVDSGRESEFLLLVSFLVMFGFIRTSAHMIRAQVSWWPGNVQVGGTHIHHLVWGICTVLITGYVAIGVNPGPPGQQIVAILFGLGMGLTLDEFALWLNLEDVYWSDKGRRSIDAVIVAAAFGGILLIGFSAWVDVATSLADGVIVVAGAVGGVGIAVAVANLIKEKFGMAFLGLVIPLVGLVGAFRLGRPDSLWARAFYKDARLERSRERYSSPRGLERVFPGLHRRAARSVTPEPEPQSAAGSG
jgi:lysyl-tRNA synthetase class 2